MLAEELQRIAHHFARYVAEHLAGLERQLERGALHVLHEDLRVVGIDARLLDRGREQLPALPRHVLIERRTRRDEQRQALAATPAAAPEALP